MNTPEAMADTLQRGIEDRKIRERYINSLDASVRQTKDWTGPEEERLLQLFDTYPDSWG